MGLESSRAGAFLFFDVVEGCVGGLVELAAAAGGSAANLAEERVSLDDMRTHSS